MVSATMAAQEDHGCRGLESPLPTSGNTSLDSDKEQLNNPGDGFAPKVRKTYTITKQRERWTEEEHKKFIEALKLYGRAWRRIEEHVGTKTAVQIRSHAQKFFSKITRESNFDDSNSMKPIEIPPPRPKKKPMHPYPRKVKTGISTPGPEKFLNAVEKEKECPTSVLSRIGSVSSGGDFFLPNGNRSSNLSEDPKLVSEGMMSNFPECEDDNSSTDERTHMELGLSSQNNAFVKGNLNELTIQSLKLFGKTLVTGPHGPSGLVQKSRRPKLYLDEREENCSRSWGAFRDGSSNVVADSGGLSSNISTRPVSFPWLTLCSNFTLVKEVHSPTPIRALSFCHYNNNNNEEKLDDNEKDGSLTGSSTTDLLGEPFSFERKRDKRSFSLYISSKKRTSGFFPYKRCLVERGSTLLKAESLEERHVHLCL